MKEAPRFIRFLHEGKIRTGILEGEKVFSLPGASTDILFDDLNVGEKEELAVSPKDIKILPPVVPSKIVGLGWNYAAHNKELASTSDKPIVFLKPPSSIIGQGDSIIIPKISKQVEHEIELGIVIGRDAKNVRRKDAMSHVAGYTIILDITARDLQWAARKKGDPWDICKGFDTFAPMGPCIVPRDGIKDPNHLALELKVNGETRQKSSTSDMILKIDAVVEYVSQFFTLKAGDVIATGTPEGVGPLRSGDKIESTIQGIGTLVNGVACEL